MLLPSRLESQEQARYDLSPQRGATTWVIDARSSLTSSTTGTTTTPGIISSLGANIYTIETGNSVALTEASIAVLLGSPKTNPLVVIRV